MAKDEPTFGAHGVGKWDVGTNRYIPLSGGSRSRLPMDTKGIRPYRGFSGVDERVENEIDDIGTLYSKLKGGSRITSQDAAFLELAIEEEEPPAESTDQPRPESEDLEL